MTGNETAQPAQPGSEEQNVSAASVDSKPQETETPWHMVQQYFREEHGVELRGMIGLITMVRDGEPLDGYFFLGRTSVHEIEGALMERMMGGGEKVKDE